jgi:hypothetical protein
VTARRRFGVQARGAALLVCAGLALAPGANAAPGSKKAPDGAPAAQAGGAPAAGPQQGLAWDDSRSVYKRRIRPAQPEEKADWAGRVTALLREEQGDTIITAVGDMILNQQISNLPEPDHQQLFRIMQEADLAFGNLEFSMNDHPELQRPFYNFRASPAFAWELAALGINIVGMANNHALDFGPQGLEDCLTALDRASIDHAGAGLSLAEARSPATTTVQGEKTRYALLAYMRYWTQKFRCSDRGAPCLATIDPAEILVTREDGKVEKVEGPLEADVLAMEDDIVMARRHNDVVLVALHNHDVSHRRAYGIQDTTPPNDRIMFHRAIEAGAEMVLGTGPHVMRGIEIYQGRPIFYSLGDFIYQYRTPDKIPVDLIHQRDGEIERPPNVSVWDRRDPREVLESILVRITRNAGRVRRVELIPVTIDDEGPLYGVPRLAGSKRGQEILARVRRLSEPYGTKFVDRGWYLELAF